jgi:SAM-dependent methyltransferase
MERPAQPLTVDELVARMRSELAQSDPLTQRWTPCETAISLAEQNAAIGAEPPLRPWQGALRPVARTAARAVLYLSRFITEAQTRFNANVVSALTALVAGVRRLDATSEMRNAQADRRFLDLERTLWRLRAEVARAGFQDSGAGATGAGTPAETPALDALYVALEDRFRGSRAEITERLRVYLPVLDAAGICPEDQLIDVGCGRGEWLELLRERGLRVRGIDSNGAMIARCRALNFDATHGDAIAFLRDQPGASTAVLTAFHVAEHLPFATLVALFDEAARVLRPGGLLIIETPNADDPRVATRDFYLDPTHRHPLPLALLTFLAETKGFDRIAAVTAEAGQPARDCALIARRP